MIVPKPPNNKPAFLNAIGIAKMPLPNEPFNRCANEPIVLLNKIKSRTNYVIQNQQQLIVHFKKTLTYLHVTYLCVQMDCNHRLCHFRFFQLKLFYKLKTIIISSLVWLDVTLRIQFMRNGIVSCMRSNYSTIAHH